MSNVIELVRPIDRSAILAELDAIADDETTGLALIASTPDGIKVRTFGDKAMVAQDIQAAAREIISMATGHMLPKLG